jgi:hypothetical protein
MPPPLLIKCTIGNTANLIDISLEIQGLRDTKGDEQPRTNNHIRTERSNIGHVDGSIDTNGLHAFLSCHRRLITTHSHCCYQKLTKLTRTNDTLICVWLYHQNLAYLGDASNVGLGNALEEHHVQRCPTIQVTVPRAHPRGPTAAVDTNATVIIDGALESLWRLHTAAATRGNSSAIRLIVRLVRVYEESHGVDVDEHAGRVERREADELTVGLSHHR